MLSVPALPGVGWLLACLAKWLAGWLAGVREKETVVGIGICNANILNPQNTIYTQGSEGVSYPWAQRHLNPKRQNNRQRVLRNSNGSIWMKTVLYTAFNEIGFSGLANLLWVKYRAYTAYSPPNKVYMSLGRYTEVHWSASWHGLEESVDILPIRPQLSADIIISITKSHTSQSLYRSETPCKKILNIFVDNKDYFSDECSGIF